MQPSLTKNQDEPVCVGYARSGRMRNAGLQGMVFGAAQMCLLLLPLSAADTHKKSPPHANPSPAQTNHPTQQPTQPVTVEGTITAVAPNQFQVQADKDQKVWLVSGHPNTKLLVTGEAKPDFLRKGLAIKFKGLCNGQQVTEPVDELTIVPPLPETFGIFSQGGAVAVPGVAAAAAGKAGKGEVSPTPQMSEIVGRITACHDKHLTLQVGPSRFVSLELSDEPVIRVAAADATIVTPPDKIVVRGKMVRGKPGFCQADDVKVTLSEPLTSASKQPAAVTPPSKEREKKKPELPF